MMRKYRARDRTIWSEEEKTSAKIFYSKRCEEDDDWDNDEDFVQNQLTWDEIQRMTQESEYCNRQIEALNMCTNE